MAEANLTAAELEAKSKAAEQARVDAAAKEQQAIKAKEEAARPKVDLKAQLQSNADAKDSNRDHNFDGTRQAGKDTLADGVSRREVATDTSAESSQLTVNQLTDRKASVRAQLPAEVKPGEVYVPEDHPSATGIKGYRSSMPTFNFRYGRGQRAMFANYWLVTNDANVQFYIESQLMNQPNSLVQIKAGTKEEYARDRNLYGMVHPVIEPLPNQEVLDARSVRRAALQARAPRTAANPDILEPETGNAQVDQMTQLDRVQTDNLARPIVDDRVQSSGNANPATASQGGFHTGMQGSTGPGSAPKAP